MNGSLIGEGRKRAEDADICAAKDDGKDKERHTAVRATTEQRYLQGDQCGTQGRPGRVNLTHVWSLPYGPRNCNAWRRALGNEGAQQLSKVLANKI